MFNSLQTEPTVLTSLRLPLLTIHPLSVKSLLTLLLENQSCIINMLTHSPPCCSFTSLLNDSLSYHILSGDAEGCACVWESEPPWLPPHTGRAQIRIATFSGFQRFCKGGHWLTTQPFLMVGSTNLPTELLEGGHRLLDRPFSESVCLFVWEAQVRKIVVIWHWKTHTT